MGNGEKIEMDCWKAGWLANAGLNLYQSSFTCLHVSLLSILYTYGYFEMVAIQMLSACGVLRKWIQ